MKTAKIRVEIRARLNPTAHSYGSTVRRSFIPIKVAPPVAWKKLPWGMESKAVAPAWIMAAPPIAETPSSKMGLEKILLATIVPAVVEAVAADIKAPLTGASIKEGRPEGCKLVVIIAVRSEFATIPASVPVPISMIATPDIFPSPLIA